jgi:membrane protein DedA with SNARE-associated domain
MLQDYIDAVVAFVRANEEWAAPVAFLVAFAESFCFLSLLWPGTAILVSIAALLAASGVGTEVLVPSILAAGIGGSLGYAVSYWIGLYFKDSIDKIWPFSRRPDLIPSGQRFFERHGAFGVFLGHFFGPVRAVIPVVAGMFNMPQLPFQIANIASAFTWAIGVIAPAFLLVSFNAYVFTYMREHEPLVALVLLALAFANAVPSTFLFWPSLILFAGVGVLGLYAGNDLLTLWLAGATGAFLGDLLFFHIGKSHREQLVDAWFLNGESKTVARATGSVAASGPRGVIASKARGIARAFVPLAAGMHAMPYAHFVPASAVSAVLWAGVLLSLRFVASLFGW